MAEVNPRDDWTDREFLDRIFSGVAFLIGLNLGMLVAILLLLGRTWRM